MWDQICANNVKCVACITITLLETLLYELTVYRSDFVFYSIISTSNFYTKNDTKNE